MGSTFFTQPVVLSCYVYNSENAPLSYPITYSYAMQETNETELISPSHLN